MADLLVLLGFDVHNLVAGLMGGVAVSFAFKKSDPWDIVGSVVVGGLFGNFVATAGGSAFFTGVVAMPLCKVWVASLRGKRNDGARNV